MKTFFVQDFSGEYLKQEIHRHECKSRKEGKQQLEQVAKIWLDKIEEPNSGIAKIIEGDNCITLEFNSGETTRAYLEFIKITTEQG
jgi:hypothetical protein